jgi:hypothetical protein
MRKKLSKRGEGEARIRIYRRRAVLRSNRSARREQLGDMKENGSQRSRGR